MADHGEKKGLLAILAGSPSSGGGEEDLGGEAKRQAARDFARAVKDGDDDAIVGAFERLRDACESSRYDDEDEE